MDIGPILVLALLTLAVTMKAATKGNPIPGYLLALLAGVIAVYATQQEEVRSQILIAWAICGTAIVSAYVARQVQKATGS
jgi:hypothetical protein